MDFENYKFRYNAYKNNTFDLDVVENTLFESKNTSYQFLRQFQLDSTGYKRFDFRMQEIYRTNNVNHNLILLPRRWVFFIDYEFINVGKRLDYKRSGLCEKELSFDDITNRPDLFVSTFMVFINGELYTRGINVLCKEDKTYLIINCKERPSREGITISDMRHFIETNAQVTVFFIPNTGVKNINTNAYRLRTMINNTGIPNRLLNLSDNVNYSTSLFYINPINDVKSIPTDGEFTDTGLYIDANVIENVIDSNPDNTSLTLTMIPLRNLLTRIKIPKGEKWFEIPMQDYPVAIENCLITDINGKFIHDARIEHYYPNIYCINNIDEIIEENELYVYVFYYENKFNKLKHLDILAAYHKYVPDYLDRYKDNTINEIVKTFDPVIVNYNIKNYRNEVDGKTELSDHFKYKISKMKEFIKADVNNFRRYLRNLGLGSNYYYVDISKIDLSQRLRTDNGDTKTVIKFFDREMYMFIFRNDFRGMYDDLIIHVDGIRYDKDIFVCRTDMLDYVYVPCELIKPDSILEIEKVTDVSRDVDFSSTNNKKIIKLDLGEYAVQHKTLFNDLFVIDKETEEYVSPDAYQMILPVKFHMDDIESDVIIDYIITQTDEGYYQLSMLNHGVLEVYSDDEMIEEPDNAYFLSFQNKKNKLYQFDIDNKKPKYSNVDLVDLDGLVVNKIRSMTDKNMIYKFKMVDGSIKIELSEDDGSGKTLAEAGLKIIDVDEVFLECPREIKIRITDDRYLNKKLALHIKKNHGILYLDDDLEKIEKIDDNFYMLPVQVTSKKDPRYFRVYSNGKLIPRHLGIVKFPELYLKGPANIYPGFVRESDRDYDLVLEIMPYMMKQVCYIKSIPNDKVINLKGLIDKPFDFKWYDIYLNGRKLVKKDVEIISANMIKLLKSESLQNLEIVENYRDKEYFGCFEDGVYDIIDELYENDKTFADNLNNSVKDLYDNEEHLVRTPIYYLDYVLRLFYDYLLQNFGMINPDEKQISYETANKFSELFDANKPYEIGFDILTSNRDSNEKTTLELNPDKE